MTHTEIIALAKQHGASAYTNRHYPDETYMTFSHEKLEAFFHAAQALEREECAVIAEDEPEIQCADGQYRCTPSGIAAAIRNRN